jgi:hypothetical protein
MTPFQPWSKFYWADWRSDPRVRMCSLAGRGLWIEMLALMHEAEPKGHLLINGRKPTDKEIGSLVGATPREVQRLTEELESLGVFSRTNAEGIIFSRRMVRDEQKATADRENGKRGGNPRLRDADNGGVNPPPNPEDKASRARHPDARCQTNKADALLESEIGRTDLLTTKGENGETHRRRSRGSSLDPAWQPSEQDLAFARERGWDDGRVLGPSGEAERFRAHHEKAGTLSKSWAASWRTWVLNGIRFDERRANGTGGARSQAGGILEAGARALARLQRDRPA